MKEVMYSKGRKRGKEDKKKGPEDGKMIFS
jgi:hypothetical protein